MNAGAAPNADPEMTPLEERLIALIKSRGPISVADYMVDALFHPQEGYYTSQTPIGADGDFTTAPEVSQIFGELIGLWLVQSWTDLGSPSPFNLIELGPGRGVLMEDILRAARLRPGFLDAAQICLVEISGRLRHEQQKRLKRDLPSIRWLDAYSEAPAAPSLIVANEFFDCLPVRQFFRVETGWRERMVAVDVETGRLAFALAETPPTPSTPLPASADAAPGDIFELNERAEAQCDEIARSLVANKGRALFIDYGHMQSGYGDTLQAIRRHAYWPALSSPGRADITAHVNFDRLSKAAFAAGAAAFGPVTQGAFLERLGLGARAARLCAGKTPEEIAAIESGALRLVAPNDMGELFKVLCVSSPGSPTPAGFE